MKDYLIFIPKECSVWSYDKYQVVLLPSLATDRNILCFASVATVLILTFILVIILTRFGDFKANISW